MGSSFVEYRGYGFWSRDGYLEHVLALVAHRIGDSPNEPWLAELRDHWHLQSSGVFIGWIHPNLDEFVTGDERRDVLLALLDDLASQAGLAEEAKQTATLFASLLRGQLKTDASSPLDYIVSGPHPYQGSLEEQ